MAKKAPLQPLDSFSMTDRVENILRKYFEDNAFQLGDALPGEVEIAEKPEVGMAESPGKLKKASRNWKKSWRSRKVLLPPPKKKKSGSTPTARNDR